MNRQGDFSRVGAESPAARVAMSAHERCPEIRSDDGEPPERGLRVLIHNETDEAVEDDRLEAAVEAVVRDAGFTAGWISVAVVDDARIHQLNRQFLSHDYPTDVLSFVLESKRPYLEGEIVASRDTAAREAAMAGWRAADEMLLYVVHGALHLVGWSDDAPLASAHMRMREAETLKGLGVSLSPRDPRWRPIAAQGPSMEAPPR